MAQDIPARLSRADGRRFGLTVGVAFLALAALLWWREHEAVASVAGLFGVLLLTAGVLAPQRLGPVYRGWMRFALALSKVTTPVFMAIVYFGVITPIGLLRRALGRGSISARSATSQWVAREGPGRSDLTRQF